MHPHEMSPEEQQMIWGRPIDGPVMTEFLQAMLNDRNRCSQATAMRGAGA